MWIVEVWHKPLATWSAIDIFGMLAVIVIGIPVAFGLVVRLFAFTCDALGIRIPPPK